MVTIISVNKVKICIFCYITLYIICMHTLLCVSIYIYMFSLVYEGPTADELRSVGSIDIYENAYFMNNLYVCIFLSVPSVNKVFIIIIIIIFILYYYYYYY